MQRKPNYRFERSERAKSKALKKAEKLQAKIDKSEARKPDSDATPKSRNEEQE